MSDYEADQLGNEIKWNSNSISQHLITKAFHTENLFCEKHGIQHLAVDGGSNKPKCHHRAQAPKTILYLGIPNPPPSRHQHVCMRLCPLIAPLTQVHPLPFI